MGKALVPLGLTLFGHLGHPSVLGLPNLALMAFLYFWALEGRRVCI